MKAAFFQIYAAFALIFVMGLLTVGLIETTADTAHAGYPDTTNGNPGNPSAPSDPGGGPPTTVGDPPDNFAPPPRYTPPLRCPDGVPDSDGCVELPSSPWRREDDNKNYTQEEYDHGCCDGIDRGKF